jgi:hypothetical protein
MRVVRSFFVISPDRPLWIRIAGLGCYAANTLSFVSLSNTRAHTPHVAALTFLLLLCYAFGFDCVMFRHALTPKTFPGFHLNFSHVPAFCVYCVFSFAFRCVVCARSRAISSFNNLISTLSLPSHSPPSLFFSSFLYSRCMLLHFMAVFYGVNLQR